MEQCCYELYHYGIKGQKWGVRRFQKKDGTLTNAGKKRYADDGGKQQESKNAQKYNKYYENYKTLGYSDIKAAKTAKGRIAAEKSLKVAGAVAVTALVAYGAYRYWDTTQDRFISPDKVMQTVHMGDAAERMKPGSPFYATYGKKDNTIYASKVFSHFNAQSKITRFYTEDGIKVASEKTGRKVLEDLIKTDPEMKAYVDRIYKPEGSLKAKYQRFNWSLVLRDDSTTVKGTKYYGLEHDKIHKKFYDELRKRGYGGIIDTNDSKNEGFTFNPVIVFDNQMKHIVGTTKATKEHLSAEQLAKGQKYARQRMTSLHPTQNSNFVVGGSAFAYAVGINTVRNKALDKQAEFVKKYIKEHPNTKLTNAEIAALY